MDFNMNLYTTNAKKMNVIPKKLFTDDIFESIFLDYLYPDANPNSSINGLTHWVQSQDVQDQQFLITCLELAEEFVECVAKSTDLPFEFDKILEGARLKKKNRPGKLFYDLLWQQNDSPINPEVGNPNLNSFKIQNFIRIQFKYEVSENSKLLYNIASELNLNGVFFTGNPMSNIASGLLEGELINSLVIRLREAIKRKGFKNEMAERKKESTQSFTKTKHYVNRLYANSPLLYGMRMFFYYRSNHEGPSMLVESNKHLMKFLEPYETGSALSSPVGWWWKREYMSEVSYRYHLIFFFDGQKTPYDPRLIDLYGPQWVSVTGGEGAYVIPFVQEWDDLPSETGLFQQPQHDSLESLLSSMQSMLMRDVYLRLNPSKKIDHFGMGKLPKRVDEVPSNDRDSVFIPK